MGLRQFVVMLLVGGAMLLGCDKKSNSADTAASAAPVASPDAKSTAATIFQFYPIDCDASAASWNWATCHDETKGFDAILKCATAARDQAKDAASKQPAPSPANPDTPCAASIEGQSRRFVTTTAVYLVDVVAWLTTHKSSLVGPLRTSSIQDLDDDKLKADMPHEYDAKYGGDAAKGESLRFGWVSGIACTKSLFRCGTETDPANKLTYVECGVQAAAVRLGVECGTSSPFHHANGKPYCPSMICDLSNPRTWLYDRSTGERVR